MAYAKTSAVDIGRYIVVTGTKGAVKIEPLVKHCGEHGITAAKVE